MNRSRLDEIENLLSATTDAEDLTDAAGFIRRCDAIDRLELHLGELSSPESAGCAERAAALHPQAVALRDRLQQRNASLVQALRRDIRSGRCLGEDLASELQRYRAKPSRNETDGNLAYDHLDVLVAGVLGTDDLVDDEPGDVLPEMFPYQPTPARIILEIVEQTDLRSHDVFVDVGSGLGIVPTVVSLLSGASSVGIEVQPAYCRHAQECARRLNVSNVSFVCQDARQADYSEGTVFYMYTPFKGAMLQQVLERLQAEGRRRTIRLCTYGPILSEAAQQQPLFPTFERSRPVPVQ